MADPAVQLDSSRNSPTYLSSLSCAWATVVGTGIITTQDAATVTNPAALLTANSARLFKRPNGRGTTLLLALGYDDELSGLTDPVIVVFGRRNSSDRWMVLPTISGSRTMTLTSAAATTDETDGTLKYTQADPSARAVDVLGCDEFIIAVQTALDGTGTKTNAIVQGKFI